MKKLFVLSFAIVALAACSSSAQKNSAKEPVKTGTAPATFRVKFDTSKGPFVVEVTRDWAPIGADRFYQLVKNNYYDEARFFRVVKGFMVQFGINKDPAVTAQWEAMPLQDDPVKQTNARATITYAATSEPNSRSAQLFINLVDNARLDAMGFAPFGKVVDGIDVVDQIYSGYGESAPQGDGPDPSRIQSEGNEYLKDFPKLDFINTARVQ